MCSFQLFCLCNDGTVSDTRCRSQCFESFQMQVDRSAADVASARKRYFCSFIFSKKCSQQIVGSSDFLNKLVIYTYLTDHRTIDSHFMAADPVNSGSDHTDRFEQDIDILDIRKIIDHHGLICHNRRCQNTKCRIFRSADFNFAHQGIAAFNYILFHRHLYY